MAAVTLRRGPNRWVLLQSAAAPALTPERVLGLLPDATTVRVQRIEGRFEGDALQQRTQVQPAPVMPSDAVPWLVEFEGSGGIIPWPGTDQHSRELGLALDAVLASPAIDQTQPVRRPVIQAPRVILPGVSSGAAEIVGAALLALAALAVIHRR